MTIVLARVLRTPLCEAQGFPRMESAGGNAERLKWQEMSRSGGKWTRFCETILREGGFAKPRQKIFEIRRDWVWVSAPQESAGGMRGGNFFGFLAETEIVK